MKQLEFLEVEIVVPVSAINYIMAIAAAMRSTSKIIVFKCHSSPGQMTKYRGFGVVTTIPRDIYFAHLAISQLP
jgi:hypothetical protein